MSIVISSLLIIVSISLFAYCVVLLGVITVNSASKRTTDAPKPDTTSKNKPDKRPIPPTPERH